MTRGGLRAAIDRAEALLCDWDGCLAIGDQLLPNVAETLKSGPPFAIVSNNSTLPRAGLRILLRAQGLSVDERHIHLAGDTMLREAANQFDGRPIEVVGTLAMRRTAHDLGMMVVKRDPEVVLLLRDTGFDFETLERVGNHVRNGALLWVANSDGSHPTLGGIAPETGALAAAVTRMTGREPDRIIGKPEPLLFRAALDALGVDAEAALMIGDNLSTDIAGAAAIGMRTCLVDRASWVDDRALDGANGTGFGLSGDERLL